MSVALRLFITSKLKDGVTVEQFNEAGNRMAAAAADEAGTTVYNWWVGGDGTVINEDGFVDEAAFGAHMGNMTSSGRLDEWMALVDVQSVQALGDVSDATREGLVPFGAVHYSLANQI